MLAQSNYGKNKGIWKPEKLFMNKQMENLIEEYKIFNST
jgi:hypothetical protein